MLYILGPCLAESRELLFEVAEKMKPIFNTLGENFYFKASFDKANRTSGSGKRGPGLETGLQWLADIRKHYGWKIITDVHETAQIPAIAEVCDGIQIPAFLCRQTDLILAAARTGKMVNIKKGQFLPPDAVEHMVAKALATKGAGHIYATERGTCFGYSDLIVDPRSFPIMAKHSKVIYDITHSTQKPSVNGSSGASRQFAPALARAALATGYCSGIFMEIHPRPDEAWSDKEAQLSFKQASQLLSQIQEVQTISQKWKEIDQNF
ncbi:MAG: 3-deoxy-8-phosphooctulonate synthase [Oligoflexales bacterium]